MSNVLIGLIGVILFIGVSLAAGSFFGESITGARSSSDSVTIATSLGQMSNAVRIYQIRNRTILPNTLGNAGTLVTGQVLKLVPKNPIVAANVPFTIDADGTATGAAGKRPKWAVMYLGQTDRAFKACLEFDRSYGNKDRLVPATMATTIDFSRAVVVRNGCHRNAGAFGGNGGVTGDYLAYLAI